MSTINRLQRLTGDHSSKQKKSPRADEISKLRTRIESIMSTAAGYYCHATISILRQFPPIEGCN